MVLAHVSLLITWLVLFRTNVKYFLSRISLNSHTITGSIPAGIFFRLP